MVGIVSSVLATSRRAAPVQFSLTSRANGVHFRYSPHFSLSRTRQILLVREYSQPSHQTPSGERDKAAVGVFTPKAAAIFIATGVALFLYFRNEKVKLQEQREKEREDAEVGRPHVGGPFSLMTHENKPFTEKDLLGKRPADKQYGPIVQPIFISVDPARDSIAQVARYVSEFHPRLIGLTGDYGTVKATCKAYRVYFSTPPDAKADDDYLVDHSIFFYFMDPNGGFVDAFGKASAVEDVVARVQKEIGVWEEKTGRKV
ncbi:Protein SCO1, mitochondrial [Grifola frondosa]|uniref:Protein SCO1, mitochondrial n=1 Tax=Grifola frondosa TaxID=5627 RepID=A0A1C7LPI0_GRIFR|nr:Protein SCO1, mitochondrial [Grifola frondosa]